MEGLQILKECHLDNEENEGASNASQNSLESLVGDVKKFLAEARCNMGTVEYANLNKMMAICYLKVLPKFSHSAKHLFNKYCKLTDG